jgi:hypothetical protein
LKKKADKRKEAKLKKKNSTTALRAVATVQRTVETHTCGGDNF